MRGILLVVGTLVGITVLCFAFLTVIQTSGEPAIGPGDGDGVTPSVPGGSDPGGDGGTTGPAGGSAHGDAPGSTEGEGEGSGKDAGGEPGAAGTEAPAIEFGDLFVAGIVKSGDGDLLAHAVVLAHPSAGSREALKQARDLAKERGTSPPLSGATDGEGAFRIEKLPRGKVWLQVQLEGYYPDSENTSWVDAGDEGLVLVMHPGSTVRGTVRDTEGNPISKVRVQAVRAPDAPGGHATDSANTGDSGVYELDAAPPGMVTITAVHQDWATESMSLEIKLGEAVDGIDFVLDEGLSIAGQVVDSEGAPIGEAMVQVTHVGSGNDLDYSSSRSVETDIDGTFVARGLEPGMHQLRASHEGHLSGDGEKATAGDTDVQLILEKAVAVTGIVFTPAGKPAPGAEVTATINADRSANPWESSASSTSAQADDEGRFSLPGLEPGKIDIVAQLVDYRESESVSVELEGGQKKEGVELRLREGVAISGTVRDSAGKAIQGAVVSAEKTAESTMGWAGARQSVSYSGMHEAGEEQLSHGSARTDGSGAFTIKGLNDGGLYHVTASMKGFVDPNASVQAEGTKAPSAGIVIVLAKAAVIRGIVLSPDGVPVEKAQVSLMKSGQALWMGGYAGSTASKEDGTFELDTIVEGTYSLFANHDDYRISEKLELSLATGETREGVELRLQVGGEIKGQVTTEAGEPISGANITCVNTAEMMTGNPDWLNATSDVSGSFTLKGVGPATYNLTCSADGYVDSGNLGYGFGTGGETHSARAGDFIVIKLSKGGTLTGRVVNESGEPVTSYELQIMTSQPRMRGAEYPIEQPSVSDLDGRFEVSGLAEGVSSVVVTADGHARKRVEVTNFRANDYTDLGEIRLSKGATLSGTVMAADGSRVTGASVSLKRADDSDTSAFLGWGGISSSVSGESGEFTLANVPAGKHRLTATHPEYSAGTLDLDVPEKGELTGLRLTMAIGGMITGIVRGADGEPMSGIGITAMPQGDMMSMGENTKNTQTDAEGRYRLGGLLEGRHMVSAQLQSAGGMGFSQRTRTVDVPASGEVVCDFIEGQQCRLFGKVLGWDASTAAIGGPQGNMLMLFSMSGGGINQTMSQIQENGSFSFDPMPSGNYQIMIFGSTTFQVTLPEAPEFRHDIQLPQAKIKGRVTRADGEAIGMMEVRGLRREAGSLLSRFAQTMTDMEGNYALQWLQDGVYDIYAEVSGYGSGVLQNIDVNGGRAVVGADIVVRPGSVLTVTVKQANGTPEPRASVLLHDELGNPVNPNGAFQGGGSGNEAGEQEISDLPPGTYRVIVGTGDGGTAWRDGVVVGSGPARVEVRLPERRGKLQALVTRSGMPLEGAGMQLVDSTGKMVIDLSSGFMAILGGATGADGLYSTGFLPTGPYTLRVRAPGVTEPIQQPVTIPADGSTLEIQVAL